MSAREPLYQRLPEIYRIRDAEQHPPYQLRAYLGLIDDVQAAIRDNIEGLYHDHFIDTCDDWVIPYIADLLGASHLKGDPWTLRADVARTVHNRRRKGTLGAVESLTYSLSGWAVHAVELRERMAWHQHLTHQRPDAGGRPPHPRRASITKPVRGGTAALRDPAELSLLNGPFDRFAQLADIKPLGAGAIRINLPNLAIFLWRLEDYRVPVTRPVPYYGGPVTTLSDRHDAAFAVRFDVHPMGEPMVLFNRHRFDPDAEPPDLTDPDAVPGPMPPARLSGASSAGRPAEYIEVAPYADDPPEAPGGIGLTLHVPDSVSPPGDTPWRFRGANLCAWEDGLVRGLGSYEIVVDPERGRVLFGVDDEGAEAEPLRDGLLVSATYGFPGPTGAHPVHREPAPDTPVRIDYHTEPGGGALATELGDLDGDKIIEIGDSRTYDLDPTAVANVVNEGGVLSLAPAGALTIRAAAGQRPVIRLGAPLRFRPARLDEATVANANVTLEGLYITWDHDAPVFNGSPDAPLIARAALNRLTLRGCTLDPGSHRALNGDRRPARRAFRLGEDYGFDEDWERAVFDQTPEIVLENTVCGPIAADEGYAFELINSIVDAAAGVDDTPAYAIHAATGDITEQWGPAMTFEGLTCFGAARVASAYGRGAIFVHPLQVFDNQRGCIKFSYFHGDGDRLPQHHGCVFGRGTAEPAVVSFTSEVFGEPGYAQLRRRSDRRLREQGPGRDEMGAFGYLLNTHRWKNINIRYREYMPVGIRPVLVPVT